MNNTIQRLYIIDINGNATLFDNVDPNKRSDSLVPLCQLTCESFPVLGLGCNMEEFIKLIISGKIAQQEAYKNFVTKVKDTDVIRNFNIYKREWEKTMQVNEGIFESIFRYIEHIKRVDPTGIFIFQTFGADLQYVLDIMRRKYSPEFVSSQIYPMGEVTIEDPDTYFIENIKTMEPGKMYGWQNSHELWKKESIGKPVFFVNEGGPIYISYICDDNADKCAYPILTFHIDYQPYILKTNTGEALTNPNYFIEKIERSGFLKLKFQN